MALVSAGEGSLHFERSGDRTVLRKAQAHSPLRFLTPRNHGHASWVYLSSLGGGFVDKDHVRLDLNVGAGASAFVSTQGPTRVYRSPRGCRNQLQVQVEAGGFLAWVPDPLSLFTGARFEQATELTLHPKASLLWVDVLTAGRVAQGEFWAFEHYVAQLKVRREKELLSETLRLDSLPGPLAERMGRFSALGSILLVGPLVKAGLSRAHAVAESPLLRGDDLLVATRFFGDDACLVRLGASSLATLSVAVKAWLDFLPEVLGDDPLARRA